MIRRKGFTLIELLVVMAILAVLAGILLPAFRSARDASQRTVCMNNFKQIDLAYKLYLDDYDEFPIPAKYTVGDQANSATDRTWVQILLPYLRTYSVFSCPSNYTSRKRSEATFDEDLVFGDTYSKYYRASQTVDIGYNYIYHSPIVNFPGVGWIATPQRRTIENPSRMVLFVDSVQLQDSAGNPKAGGSYLVVPPCRFSRRFGDSFNIPIVNDVTLAFFSAHPAWDVTPNGALKTFGGAYPWHIGRFNVMFADGSMKSLRPRQLTAGCIVSGSWTGLITDDAAYLWDFN